MAAQGKFISSEVTPGDKIYVDPTVVPWSLAFGDGMLKQLSMDDSLLRHFLDHWNHECVSWLLSGDSIGTSIIKIIYIYIIIIIILVVIIIIITVIANGEVVSLTLLKDTFHWNARVLRTLGPRRTACSWSHFHDQIMAKPIRQPLGFPWIFINKAF